MRLLKEIFRKDNVNKYGKAICREAVRGIIPKDGKLLMVYSSKDGDYKFPGGGVNQGESYEEALSREIREECGATLIGINGEFGQTVEYDIANEQEFDIFKMISYYYICEVDSVFGEQCLDDYEAKLGFKPVWIDIESAISANKAILKNKSSIPKWTRRETFVLEEVLSALLMR